jgi:tetratricopeptide (TPR) repeat protein
VKAVLRGSLAGLLSSTSLALASDADLVRQLGGASHAEREAASQALWRRGDEAMPVLRAAAASDDPEIALRAREILRQLDRGIYPDTPPEIAELLRRLPSLPPEEIARVVSSNLTDRVLGPRLLARAAAAARLRGEEDILAALLRSGVRPPLTTLLDQGRTDEALRLLRLAGRAGLAGFPALAADAHWVEGALPELTRELEVGPAQPGDSALRAAVAFHRGEYAESATLAHAARLPSLAAVGLALTGDWSRLDDLPWWDETQRRVVLDTARLARARLLGQPDEARQAVDEVIRHAKESPDDLWFALEILLVNDAWPALPDFFGAVSNALLEADYAYEFFQPDRLRAVAAAAWDATDNPNLRHRLLTWSQELTGRAPVDRRAEVRVVEQFSGRPARPAAEPTWEDLVADARAQLAGNPSAAGAMLVLGWAADRAGRPEEAADWQRRAGWQILLRADFDPGRLNPVFFRHGTEPYWQRTVDMVARLRRYEPDFLPHLEAVFERAVRGEHLPSAIGWLELGRLRFLSPARSYAGLQGYLFHARRLAELHLHFALAHGRAEAAERLLDAHLDLLLHDAVPVRRRLADAGRADFARHFAERAFDRMAERLVPHPAALAARNSAAWLAATARVRLEAALALLDQAQPTAETLPAHVRDTRAELLFQLGRDAEAITLAEQNVAESPDDPHYTRQLARLRRGERDTPPE